MADRRPSPATPPRFPTLLRKLHNHFPNTTQLVGLATLVISGAILLLLSGVTVTATILALIVLTPLILLTVPLWVPMLAITLAVASIGVFTVSVVGGTTWVYRYVKGDQPVGAERVDYTRSRIANTAEQLREYMLSKVKDVVPGA